MLPLLLLCTSCRLLVSALGAGCWLPLVATVLVVDAADDEIPEGIELLVFTLAASRIVDSVLVNQVFDRWWAASSACAFMRFNSELVVCSLPARS